MILILAELERAHLGSEIRVKTRVPVYAMTDSGDNTYRQVAAREWRTRNQFSGYLCICAAQDSIQDNELFVKEVWTADGNIT